MNVKGVEEVPLEWGGKLVFVNSIVGGSIDARFMPAILKGIMSRMEQGPLTGSYARDVRVIVYDGKMHPVDSNEISFMLAGRNAFSEAFKNAGPKILAAILSCRHFKRILGLPLYLLYYRYGNVLSGDSCQSVCDGFRSTRNSSPPIESGAVFQWTRSFYRCHVFE